ncbi:MFS transporter [Saccharopolyspora sp. NPDC050642]|uniref:MFS transporter n=1 Tax=Saccharopolyspora sp. NPDC050642 TaxID=3157099 RepID=UPI00340F3159
MSSSLKSPPADRAQRARAATVAAFMGTAIEWYDFYIFGTAAALVFGKVFYPDVAAGSALMASFATFWVGFLARPIGGVVFGHLGDRMGRKNTLVITLLMMGCATTLIGLLPGYAQIGALAPVLLIVLRALQGIAVGGEWGGAVVLATESAEGKRRGRAGMWVQQGSPAGSILSTLVFLAVGQLPTEQFMSWGWRIPFLLSAVLVVVGLVVRLKIEESDDFAQARERQAVVRAPVVEAFRSAPKIVWLGVGASIMGISSAYFNNTFTLSWATADLGVPRQTMLNILLVTAILQFAWQPVASRLSAARGEARVMLFGLCFAAILAIPKFLALMSADPFAIVVTLGLSTLGTTAYYAMLASFLARAFPTNIRYTGVSLCYQLCATFVGGATPLVGQWILNATDGSPWAVACFYVALLAATGVSVFFLNRARATSVEEA